MTTGLIAAQANSWLDGLTGFWVELHTADPGAAGTTSTCTGSVGASRKQSTMNAAAAGSKAQSAGGSWSAWDGGSVTVTHIAVWTASSAGTCLFTGALTAGKAMTNGDTFNLTSLSIAITPLAA
jgi:hypothetical protein